jgi:hypothetical protein
MPTTRIVRHDRDAVAWRRAVDIRVHRVQHDRGTRNIVPITGTSTTALTARTIAAH